MRCDHSKIDIDKIDINIKIVQGDEKGQSMMINSTRRWHYSKRICTHCQGTYFKQLLVGINET